jgi:hypothetical protein
MAVKLNSYFIILFFILVTLSITGQSIVVTDYPDYKDREQHKRFLKKRKTVSEWQINKLKEGALIVKLRTNDLVIAALKKQGNDKLAEKKTLEQYAINKTIVIAFLDYYKFSKVYFMYSHYHDSLLKGKRTDIFLDSNLQIDKAIILKENFYLLAEKDFVYNSSIGFVKEDSAKTVHEKGSVANEVLLVIKNKYGHQLKNPFPYIVNYHNGFKNPIPGRYFDFPIKIYKTSLQKDSVSFTVNKNFTTEQQEIKKGISKATIVHPNETTRIVEIEKKYLYERIAVSVENLNDDLIRFHQNSQMPSDQDLNDPLIKPYLY